MATEDEKEIKNDTPQTPKNFFKKYLDLLSTDGELVSVDFLLRHWKTFLFIVIMLFLYIGNRYNCTRKMLEIKRLHAQIENLRNESITLSSELTGIGQPSQIQQMLESKGIEIAPAVTPSYKLIRKKYGDK